MKAAPFVKSAKTETSVVNSRNELEAILRRYGATQFIVANDYGKAELPTGVKGLLGAPQTPVVTP